jgi:putative hydrolase of the HAD superfamily
MIQAVLWDIGGPVNDETIQEARFDDAALAAARTLREVSAESYQEICQDAVECFAPRAYRYILWRLAGGSLDLYDALRRQVSASQYEHFAVRPAVPGILAELSSRYSLGLVANSGASMLDRLQDHGLLDYFRSRKPGALLGLEKPDVRYFQAVLTELRVEPASAVMIGDRIDCDVVPAKMLGLKTVRLRVGRHRLQRPRYPEEAPDVEIEEIGDVMEVLRSW